MSDSLENILKNTYDKDKLDFWFETNETKLLNDLNNCNKKNLFSCSGTEEFSTLRKYFKEFKDANNNVLDETLINNICQYVQDLNKTFIDKKKQLPVVQNETLTDAQNETLTDAQNETLTDAQNETLTDAQNETLTNVQIALLQLMKTKWNAKFKNYLEKQLILKLNKNFENDTIVQQNTINHIIKDENLVDLLNLEADFEHCAESPYWCANPRLKSLETLQKMTRVYTYSNVFIEIRRIMKGNMDLMNYFIKNLKLTVKLFKNNIIIVINKWIEKLNKKHDEAKKNKNYEKIINALSESETLLLSCIVDLEDKQIHEFIEMITNLLIPIECNGEKPSTHSKMDLRDLLSEKVDGNLVEIFRYLDNNNEFKGKLYEIVKHADILDPLTRLLNSLYSVAYYLYHFNHIALFLLPDQFFFDYSIQNFMTINSDEFTKRTPGTEQFITSPLFNELETTLTKSKYNSGSLKIYLRKSPYSAHAVSLKFHKNTEDKYAFNYFDTNGDLKAFTISRLNDFIKQQLNNDKLFDIQNHYLEYMQDPTIEKAFHIVIDPRIIYNYLNLCDTPYCDTTIKQLYATNNNIEGGLCVLMDLFATFLWSIFIIKNPTSNFKDFLIQYNQVVYEHPLLYSTIIYKFLLLTIEKYNDHNLMIITACINSNISSPQEIVAKVKKQRRPYINKKFEEEKDLKKEQREQEQQLKEQREQEQQTIEQLVKEAEEAEVKVKVEELVKVAQEAEAVAAKAVAEVEKTEAQNYTVIVNKELIKQAEEAILVARTKAEDAFKKANEVEKIKRQITETLESISTDKTNEKKLNEYTSKTKETQEAINKRTLVENIREKLSILQNRLIQNSSIEQKLKAAEAAAAKAEAAARYAIQNKRNAIQNKRNANVKKNELEEDAKAKEEAAEAAKVKAEAAEADAKAKAEAAGAKAAEAAEAEAEAAKVKAEAAEADAKAKAEVKAAKKEVEAANKEVVNTQKNKGIKEAATKANKTDKKKAAEAAEAEEAVAKASARAAAARAAREAAEAAAREIASEEAVAEAATGADEARKAADEAREAADEARKAADEARKAADEARKAADEARKAADEAGKVADEAGKVADEAIKAADEARKAADEAREARKAENTLTGGGYAKYIQFSLSRDSLHIIQNVIILSVFKFARYTYYKKNIVNYGNDLVYLLDYVMTLIICIIFYILGFEKISIGMFIDQLLSMVLYDKINDDKALLLPYYLPLVLI
jgi:hypothetical protein